jgi:hypothetical protein
MEKEEEEEEGEDTCFFFLFSSMAGPTRFAGRRRGPFISASSSSSSSSIEGSEISRPKCRQRAEKAAVAAREPAMREGEMPREGVSLRIPFLSRMSCAAESCSLVGSIVPSTVPVRISAARGAAVRRRERAEKRGSGEEEERRGEGDVSSCTLTGVCETVSPVLFSPVLFSPVLFFFLISLQYRPSASVVLLCLLLDTWAGGIVGGRKRFYVFATPPVQSRTGASPEEYMQECDILTLGGTKNERLQHA